jgi:hypothetical protein
MSTARKRPKDQEYTGSVLHKWGEDPKAGGSLTVENNGSEFYPLATNR